MTSSCAEVITEAKSVVKGGVSALRSGGDEADLDTVSACDPGFSLAGIFDSSPEITIRRPAKYPEAGTLQRIAVLPVKGAGSDQFAQEFERTLTAIKVDGQPHYQVVARADLDRVLQEQKLGRQAIIQTSTAAKLGRILGVDGIYLTQITTHSVADQPYQDSSCATPDCARSQKVQCTSRTATFASLPKLIDAQTGQVVYAGQIGGTKVEKYCPGGLSTGLPDGQVMMAEVIKEAMASFRKDVAPTACKKHMNVLASPKGMTTEAAEERFRGAAEFMLAGRPDRACPSWRKLAADGEESISLFNNLSICAEIDEDLQAALDYCKRADGLLTRPDKNINACLDHMTKRIAEAGTEGTAGCRPLRAAVDVLEAQTRLIQQGFLEGSADGLIGVSTLAAVSEFQDANSLSADGKLTTCLLEELRQLATASSQ